jgi:transitional endoplasmic reticulum ATPase
MSKPKVAAAKAEDQFSFLDNEEKIADYFSYYQDFFIYNLAKNLKHTSLVAKKIIQQYEYLLKDKVEFTGGKLDPKTGRRYDEVSMSNSKSAVKASDWSLFVNFFKELVAKGEPDGCMIPNNLKLFSDVFGLPDHMKWPLIFSETMRLEDDFGSVIKDILTGKAKNLGRLTSRVIPDLTKEQRADIEEATSMVSDLCRKGLLTPCVEISDDDDEIEYSEVPPYVRELLFDVDLTKEKIVLEIIGEPTVIPELNIEHFPHLDKQVQSILGIIKGAIASGEKGINILLYGPAGSGKTALAAAISQALELEMYTIGEQNPDEEGEHEYKNGSGTSKFRISKLQQAHALLKDNKGAILFFDEIEDTLNKGTDSSKKPDVFSKILLNRLLETNPIVTIWAGNDLEKFHESVLQRFSYSLPVTYPPTLMRERIWKTQTVKNKIEISDADRLQLARDFVAPPRIIGKALQNARLTGNTDVKSIIDFIEQSSLITYGSEDALRLNSGLSRFFSRDLLPQDLRDKVDSWIEGAGKKSPVSLYIDAVRGAGVNALAEDIAERLIMHPNIVDAAGLSTDSMMMSAVDKIKMVFNGAARGNQLLIIQNIEAFNEAPENPQDKWRNDLVGQFARSLSEHDLPIVVSSMKEGLKLPPTLDPLFTIKGKMGTLSEGQLKRASQIYFGFEWPAEKQVGKGIVPADLSLVRKIVEKLPAEPTQDEIMALVISQARARSGLSAGQKVGF